MAKKNRQSKRLGAGEREFNKEPESDIPLSVELAEELESLTPTQQLDLSKWLSIRVNHAQTSPDHIDAMERIERYRLAYLKGVQRTNTNMEGASDYRTFLAASQADSVTARLVSVFSTDPIIKVEGGNELGRQNAPSTEIFLNYHHNFNINLPAHGLAISSLMTIEGHAILYAPYRYEIDSDSKEIIKTQVFINGSGKSMKVDTSDIEEVRKANEKGFVAKDPVEYVADERKKSKVIKYYPDLEVHSRKDYIIPRGVLPYPIHERPPWEGIRQYMTWGELKELEKDGKIYKGALKKVEVYLKKHRPLPSDENEAPVTKNTGEDKITSMNDVPFEKDALDSVLPVWVIYGLQFNPKENKMLEMVTVYHHESTTVLQTRQNKLIGKPRGIYHLRLMQVPFRFEGIGVIEITYMGERAINDLTNFVLDEGRIFSCIPFWYNKKRFPNGISQFEFWKGVGVINKEKDFGALQFHDRRPMDMNVANFIRAHTERRSGQGDLQLGRESDVTGKQPPTARGVISILREGQVKYSLLNYALVLELVRFAQYEMLIFQQLLGDSPVIVELLGEDGKAIFPKGLSRTQILGSFLYKANHAAQNMVRELDAEINFMLYDRMRDNQFIASSMEAFYNMTRDTLLSAGKREPLWMKPLSFYQEKTGRPSVGNLSPGEQKFAEELMNSGVPMERIKDLLKQIREGAPSPNATEQEPVSAEAENLILAGGGNGASPV